MRALLLAAAAWMLLGLTATGVAAAAPTDPVVRAIDAALASGQITPEDARQFRLDWRASARAVRTAPTSTRRANIAEVREFTSNLASRGGLTPRRIAPALLSVRATTTVMGSRGPFPSHESELQIPGEVVVFTYYSGRGVQFQPFETLKQGMRELNQIEPDIVAARAIADRLMQLSSRSDSVTTWEYFFPFGGPSRPWTSSISQALATEFFHRVGTSVPAGEGTPYEQVAQSVTRSFLLSASRGGVSVPEGGGRFFVMYPFAPAQRILNGHLQVILNVNRYATSSGSALAKRVVSEGIDGVVPILPRFDTGGWSNYQPGQEADLGYHEFQTEQLLKLGEETSNPVLAEYGARFNRYLETAPQLTIPATSWPAMVGPVDGWRDTVTIRYQTDKRAKVTMVLTNAETGAEVRRVSTTSGRGSAALMWDGRTSSGRSAPPGTYIARLTATDIVGNRRVGELSSPLVIIEDAAPPVLRLMTVAQRGTVGVVSVAAFDVGSGWIDAELRIDGAVVAEARGPRMGTITLRAVRPAAAIRRGVVHLRDSSGNETVQPVTPAG